MSPYTDDRKFAIAEYLVNLQSIMEGKEDAGRARGSTLAGEYERYYGTLTHLIRSEPDARQSTDNTSRPQDRAAGPRSQPRSG